MEQDFFIWNLDLNDQLTTVLTSKVISVAMGVAIICFVCSLAYNYLKSGFENFVSDKKEKFPDYEDIARCLVLIFCISLYLPIAQVIIGTIEAINKSTEIGPEYVAEFAANAQKFTESQMNSVDADKLTSDALENNELSGALGEYAEKEKGKAEETPTGTPGLFSSINALVTFLNPMTHSALMLHSVALLLVTIIKKIILGITVVVVKLLIILGPLAFAVTILPVFKNQLSQWFGTIVNAGLVFTTLNILESIMAAVFAHIIAPKSVFDIEQYTTGSEMLALDIIIIVMYCSVFWITSKIVGKGDAGRVISKLVGAATAATAIVLGGTAAVGASGGNVSNVASAGKNLIENGE